MRGGCGCILAFVVLGVIAVAAGGHAHADAGGLIIRFVLGGIAGLLVYAVRGGHLPKPVQEVRPTGPWSCHSCGSVNKAELRGCHSCGEART